MSITIYNNKIKFTSTYSGVPDLEHELIDSLVVQEKLICAIWYASKLPKKDNKLAYLYYEDLNHFSKSEYLYFPVPDGAGMVLKPHIRSRYQIRDVKEHLSLFKNNSIGTYEHS